MAQFSTSRPSFDSQSASGQWTISAEEKLNYDKQFDQLSPSGGFLRGDQAKTLFLKSNLSPPILGQIWDLADFTKDGKIDKLEFAIAMKLIKLKLQGVTLPKTLPPSMRKQQTKFDISAFAQTPLTTSSSTSVFDSITSTGSAANNISLLTTSSISRTNPIISNGTSAGPMMGLAMEGSHPGFGHMMMAHNVPLPVAVPKFGGSHLMTLPGGSSSSAADLPVTRSSPGSDWSIPKSSRLKYNQVFNLNDISKTGFISGMQARFILKQTGLPESILAQLWNLSDIDNDGRLTQEEFVLAMYLTDVAKSGGIIPLVLPPDLIPPSYRLTSNTVGSTGSNLLSTGSFGNLLEPEKDMENGMGSLFYTFEDKRRDNFNKGNVELERRRQALEESRKKERERHEKKAKEEREQRERERLEQERRKQIQIERQLEIQQAAEREKEEARKRVIEQREAAQREMERQRRLEFERLRRRELLQQKLREQETVTSLHAKTKELDVEIIALVEKKDQLGVRVSDLQAREKEQKMGVDAMSRSRDMKMAAVFQRQAKLKELNNSLNMIQPEKQNVLERVSNIKESENFDSHSSLKISRDFRQQTMDELRSTVEKNRKQTSSKLVELDQCNARLNNLREELNKHLLEVEAMNRVQQDKVRDLQEARRAKEASLMRKNSMEKIKRLQLKAAAGSHMKMVELKEEASKQQLCSKQAVDKFEEKNSSSPATVNQPKMVSGARQNAEDEKKKEDVKRRIAEMQQKRLEQKMLQDSSNVDVKKVTETPPITSVDSMRANLERFRAIYNFEARSPDELSINIGDVVMVDVSKDSEPGWYYGSNGGKKGWFPINYVEASGESSSVPATNKNTDVQPIPAMQRPQPPPQSMKPSKSPAPQEVIQSSETSAFTSAGRIEDASPIPGQGHKISGLKCCALYPWQAKKDNHLTFEKDSVIEVTEQQAMWWFGSCNGKSGWFPKAYVKEIQSSSLVTAQEKSSPSLKRRAPVPPQASASGKGAVAKEYVACYTFTSGEKGDLNFEVGEVVNVSETEGDWWKGTCGGRSGIFPASYVAPKVEQAVTDITSSSSAREIATVIAPYTASAPNQLSLKMGQLVLIKKKNDSGWWEGELQVRGKKKQVGWFPANYVTVRTPGTTKVKPVDQVMAMYDYKAQNDDEISFSRGAMIHVIDRSDPDWWKGYSESNTGLQGLFPSNYVRDMSHGGSSGATQWTLQQRDMSPEEIRRQQHIHELIVSEESYLKDLEMANTGFQIPLREKKILTEQEINTLFVNWNELIMCSAKLAKAFRVRKKNSGDGGPGAVVSLIGDILCEQLPHLQPYVRFCSCQLNASSLLQEKIDNDSEFKKFVKTCESGSSFKGLPVSSYLVKPMQRITKYPLLIEKILKHTCEGHVDHNHLILALERAEDICSQVNEGVREKENADRQEWLQSHINLEGLNDRLVFNSATNCLGQRRFLHCGTLYKHKSNKELVGFLFNDFLLLTTATRPLNMPVNDFIFSSKNNPQFRLYKMPIFLNEVLIRLPTDPVPGGNSVAEEDIALFHLSHVDRVYTLRAENVNERTAWISNIKTASQLYIDTEKKKREKAYHARSQRTAGIGRLMVNIVEGCNLVKSSTGRNDPYCEVTMGVQSHTTKTVQDTLNPKWGTSMQFFVKDILQDVLCISVFQRDMFSPDDFLGRTEIRIADIKRDMAANKGPLMKRLLLHEVESGEVVVKVDLQLFSNDT